MSNPFAERDKRLYGQSFWSPYVCGVILGLTLLFAFYSMGRGLGSSGAFARLTIAATNVIAPEYTAENPYTASYVKGGENPLNDWLIWEVFGVVLGGLFGAFAWGRFKGEVARGPNMARGGRLWLALIGGFLSGWGARLAAGCTSGQALTGGASLAAGSWVFMFCIFGGAYAAAWFFRKEWL